MSRRSRRRVVPVVLIVAIAACGGSGDEATPRTTSTTEASTITSTTISTTSTAASDTSSIQVGPPDRPAELVAPAEVTGLAPLLVALHGYIGSADRIDRYLGLTQQAAPRGLYVLLPNGTEETRGRRFWDASPACCNFTGRPVDDVGYLAGLIEEAIDTHPIDPERVYAIGYSNGGFMAYRLACDRADLVAAVVVLSGADVPTREECEPSRPVSVLHTHGTADIAILYQGGGDGEPYPGAVESVARWAERNGCEPGAHEVEAVDLDRRVDGAEATAQVYDGCPAGVGVQLFTLVGSYHGPDFDHEDVGTELLDWLLARTR